VTDVGDFLAAHPWFVGAWLLIIVVAVVDIARSRIRARRRPPGQ
jgi:hypothetical protein